MQLTKYTDYSLRLLVYLSLHSDRRCTIDEVSSNFNISRSHLTKIVHNLGQRGIIITTRGIGGGMRLARAPETIRLGDLAKTTEPNHPLIDCMNPQCPILPGCRLVAALNEAQESFFATLNRYTLADVVTNEQELIRLLSRAPNNNP